MGMYDEVICEYPLPDGYDATGVVFQTKDLTDDLRRWTITRNGLLVDANGHDCYPRPRPTLVRIVHSNSVASGHGFICTEDDSPPMWWSYTFWFLDGRVIGVAGGAEPLPGNHIPTGGILGESRGEQMKPALTQDEWRAYAASKWTEPRSMAITRMDDEGDYHGGAAIALHGQPFGFTWADVDLL